MLSMMRSVILRPTPPTSSATLQIYRLFAKKSNKLKKKHNFTPTSSTTTFSEKDITQNQRDFCNHLRNDRATFVIGHGPPGTGKTLLSCFVGVENIMAKQHSKLIITRPCVSVERDLGYLPGTIDKKMDPWLQPIYENLEITYESQRVNRNILTDKIEIAPLSFIRGRTFHDSYIIADEMQNASIHEVKSLLTRVGENSKIIFTGDLSQSDISNTINGLDDLIMRIKQISGSNYTIDQNIKITEFTDEDIKRSEFVKLITSLYY